MPPRPTTKRRRVNTPYPMWIPLPQPCLRSLIPPGRYYMAVPPDMYLPWAVLSPHLMKPMCHCGHENFCDSNNCKNSENCLKMRPYFCPYGNKDDAESNVAKRPRDYDFEDTNQSTSISPNMRICKGCGTRWLLHGADEIFQEDSATQSCDPARAIIDMPDTPTQEGKQTVQKKSSTSPRNIDRSTTPSPQPMVHNYNWEDAENANRQPSSDGPRDVNDGYRDTESNTPYLEDNPEETEASGKAAEELIISPDDLEHHMDLPEHISQARKKQGKICCARKPAPAAPSKAQSAKGIARKFLYKSRKVSGCECYNKKYYTKKTFGKLNQDGVQTKEFKRVASKSRNLSKCACLPNRQPYRSDTDVSWGNAPSQTQSPSNLTSSGTDAPNAARQDFPKTASKSRNTLDGECSTKNKSSENCKCVMPPAYKQLSCDENDLTKCSCSTPFS